MKLTKTIWRIFCRAGVFVLTAEYIIFNIKHPKPDWPVYIFFVGGIVICAFFGWETKDN